MTLAPGALPYNCGIASVGDTLSLTITRRGKEAGVEKRFVTGLVRRGHRLGGRGRRNPYSRPSSSIRRTSCRLAHSAVYRRRISSSGWARSGTITVTKPPAAPARTPL